MELKNRKSLSKLPFPLGKIYFHEMRDIKLKIRIVCVPTPDIIIFKALISLCSNDPQPHFITNKETNWPNKIVSKFSRRVEFGLACWFEKTHKMTMEIFL